MPKKKKKTTKKINSALLIDKFKRTRPILKFWGGFLFLILLYFGISYFPFYETYILTPVSSIYAKASSLILNLFGEGTSSSGVQISSNEFSISVKKGCDGIAATIFYISCILWTPGPKKSKINGILFGIIILSGLNLIRVVSLFWIGAYVPSIFDFMHVEFWQVAYIGIAVFLYVYWLYNIPNEKVQYA